MWGIRKKPIVMTIIAVGVVAAAGIGYAAFSASTTSTGSTAAASLAATINNGSSLSFNSSSHCANLLPGESCSASFTVKNTGSVSSTLTASVDDSSNCFTSVVSLDAGVAEEGDAHSDYDPEQTDSGTVTTTLNANADNTCQGDSNTATVTLAVAASASPRD